MAKPGKGLISTTRAEVRATVTMNLLAQQGPGNAPGLANAALYLAKALHQEILDLEHLETAKMKEEELQDLSAALISLSFSLDAMRGQAASLGDEALKAAFGESTTALESAIQHHQAAPAFAKVYGSMKGIAR